MCIAGKIVAGATVALAGAALLVFVTMNILKEEWVYLRTSRYLVNSSKCHIPDIDPRHPSIVKYLKISPPVVCSRQPPLTYTAVVDGRQVLKVDKRAIDAYTSSSEPLACCYSVITRVEESRNSVGSCVYFDEEVILAVEVEFLYVKCSLKSVIIYYNMHAVVQIKSEKQKDAIGLNASIQEGIPGQPPPNVLILGIDAMSRLNMIRTMPRTVSYLHSNKWLEFRGYNKIFDNTRENVYAVLMGLNYTQSNDIMCFPNKRHRLGQCPFIWNDFKQNGYVTSYAEDTKLGSIFNHGDSLGFKNKPTDYYFHPFIYEAELTMPHQMWRWSYACLGHTSPTDYVLNYTLDILRADNKKAVFAFSWLNNFSHDYHNIPSDTDERILRFMKDLESTSNFNNTIVIFLSDHGMRFGNIRNTYVGWLEERLPFFYMWVPEWFREKYPDAYKNLQDNQHKLTSPYDLHMTLRDIVDMSVGKTSNGCKGCPSCVSLFSPVKTDRACADASISDHWCTCHSQLEMSSKDPTVQRAARVAVQEVNANVAAIGDKCATVALDSVTSARLKGDNDESDNKEFKDYVVVFSTTPGNMLFDATVRNWLNNKLPDSKYEVLGMISRINSYKETSKCIGDKKLKLYCYCL